jgi:hypothetical protein
VNIDIEIYYNIFNSAEHFGSNFIMHSSSE